MAKTIKQMADALGVDKQRVYRYIKKNCISEAHQKNGVMYYDEVVEKRIKQAFSQNEPYQESASSDTVFDVLLKQSEMLRKELEIPIAEMKKTRIVFLAYLLTCADAPRSDRNLSATRFGFGFSVLFPHSIDGQRSRNITYQNFQSVFLRFFVYNVLIKSLTIKKETVVFDRPERACYN